METISDLKINTYPKGLITLAKVFTLGAVILVISVSISILKNDPEDFTLTTVIALCTFPGLSGFFLYLTLTDFVIVSNNVISWKFFGSHKINVNNITKIIQRREAFVYGQKGVYLTIEDQKKKQHTMCVHTPEGEKLVGDIIKLINSRN